MPIGKGRRIGGNWSGPIDAIFGGWEVTVIEKATSGFPVFIIDSNNSSGVNFENNGNSLNRPNQTCNPTTGASTFSKCFNTSCFSAPPSGELGNANRTPLSGPDFINTDFSLIKHFALPREGIRLDFRAEVFNLFNHAQFGSPGADFNSPATFGAISSTVNNPRLFQLALKFGLLRRIALLLLLTGFVLRAQPARRKIIIDEDCSGPGGSNLQTVAMLAKAPGVDVLGIAVMSGDQSRDQEVAHTLRLLEIMGRTDIPVLVGAASLRCCAPRMKRASGRSATARLPIPEHGANPLPPSPRANPPSSPPMKTPPTSCCVWSTSIRAK